jgi:serine protease Do
VITSDGKKYPAKVLAIDPVQDLAVVKITADEGRKFPAVKLGDSSNLQIGQSVIAIGNALGEFDNTVSVGVISGLQRSITAGGGGTSETLENLIQTDAAINEGNSGGPLLNLKGEVIGVNTAIADNAQNVGFVLPVNAAKRDVEQVKNSGKITYAYLGIYYTAVSDDIQKENDLPVNYGAWVASPGDSANGKAIASVIAGSPAKKAGLKDGDIILEINGEKITPTATLSQIIAKYNPGDKVTLKVYRGDKQIDVETTLGDRNENQ